jgi:hypothetical protein
VGVLVLAGWSAVGFGQANPERVDPTVAPPPTAAGATPKRATGEEGPPSGPSASFSLGGSYTIPSNLEDSRGRVGIYRGGAELTVSTPLGGLAEGLTGSLGILNEWSWYDFSGPFRPASQVTTVRVTPGLFYRLDDKWSLLGSFTLDASGETNADVGQALTYGGVVGARYQVRPGLAYTFGVAGSTVLEDGGTVFPFLGVEWDLTEKLKFVTRGPGAQLTYSVSPELDLTAQVSYENRAFRLASDANAYRGGEGVLRDQRVTLGVQAQWTPVPGLSLRAEAGFVPWSEIRVDDNDGNPLDALTVTPTGYVGVSATLRF